ncbi:MAG: STAS domain-containing protein [Phycisphaerales bacterium]|nr:STAS domain-containing protein [Phycisphaerales bacterium]
MLTINTHTDEASKAIVVSLCGDAGMAELDLLDAGLKKVVALRPTLAIIDLAGLKFASSIALGKLIDFHRGMTRHGGRVILAGAGLNVSNVIRASRLDQFFEIYANVREALGEAAATAKALGFEGLGH